MNQPMNQLGKCQPIKSNPCGHRGPAGGRYRGRWPV